MLRTSTIALWFFLCCLSLNSQTAVSQELELKDGDRVVFLGDGLIEQAQYEGWIEVMLSTAFPERHVTFRNIGWSGDTPGGASRFGLSLLQAGREPADEGWQQLKKQIELTQPTVLILGYGMASALEGGVKGLGNFKSDYLKLLAAANEISPGIRFVFLSPVQTTNAWDEENKESIAAYSKSIAEIAAESKSPFVDLTQALSAADLRRDPIHLNANGYRSAAVEIAKQLKLPDSGWQTNSNSETLRQVILTKNQWWFHRSRPANMAYVFGFRKREQGQNAVEIPQFDSLIQQEESKIAKLRSLKPTMLQQSEPRLKSKYAEFTPQPTPEFTIADGWEISLWAENPLLNKPIHMNFDPKGRLWIASSEAYPMIEVGQSAPDRIIVLEDSNGDGKANKSTVFADGLLIPTGIAPGNGGVYVAQSTDLLFLKDTDGDGKADSKTRVLSGFGTEDTHHNLHTLRWGPDGHLYMNQSVYTRTDAETPHGIARLKAGGGFRYNTQTMQMDVFFRGLWNSWGHQFDEFGQSFLSDGAGFAGIAYTFPGATFNPVAKARHLLDLISPGRWPKFASLEIVQGESFPDAWQGSIITCDFRANRVTRFTLAEQDSGFVTTQQADLVRTSAATFRPIDVKQGPDGALYIADWSNPIINHGEVDFRDPRRDRWHGRIWRAVWKGAKAKQTADLSKLKIADLLELLKSSDRYDRDQAKRVLIERKDETIEALTDWVEQQKSGADKLKALWLCQSQSILPVDHLNECLSDSDYRVRAAAVRVVASLSDPRMEPQPQLNSKTALQLLADAVSDSHPRVRLEAVSALTRHRSSEAARIALAVLSHPEDRFIEHALALAVNELAEPIMNSLSNGGFQSDAETEQLEFILSNIEPALASEFLASRLESGPIPESGPWIELIGKSGGAKELAVLLAHAVDKKFGEPATVRALNALAGAQRVRRVRPAGDVTKVEKLLVATNPEIASASARLAGDLRVQRLSPKLLELASSQDERQSVQTAAIDALSKLGGKPVIAGLSKIANSAEGQVRQSAIIALAKLSATSAQEPIQSYFQEAEEQQALSLWRGLLAIRGFGKKFSQTVSADTLSETAIAAGLRATRDGGRNEPELQAALTPLLQTETINMTPEKIQEMAKLVSNGDPANGELVYRRQDLACSNCHAIGGIGGKVGPDMTSLGASAPVDYLIESLFDPNAKIKENYHAVTVVTEDDQIFTGIETESSDEELVLRDANDKVLRIPQAEVVLKKPAQSLMPVGVVDRLSSKEQVDLVSFLSKLGKPGEFDASQGGVARIFEIYAGTHRREQQGSDKIINGEVKDGWVRLPTRVNGDMPKSFLIENTKQHFNISLVNIYARTNLEVAQNKSVSFEITTPGALWIDGERVEAEQGSKQKRFSTKLAAGEHVVLVRVDARALPDVFRLESQDVAFVGVDK